MPEMRSVRWRPFTSALTVSPGRRPRVLAKPADTSAGSTPWPDTACAALSRGWPAARLSRFMRAG